MARRNRRRTTWIGTSDTSSQAVSVSPYSITLVTETEVNEVVGPDSTVLRIVGGYRLRMARNSLETTESMILAMAIRVANPSLPDIDPGTAPGSEDWMWYEEAAVSAPSQQFKYWNGSAAVNYNSNQLAEWAGRFNLVDIRAKRKLVQGNELRLEVGPTAIVGTGFSYALDYYFRTLVALP